MSQPLMYPSKAISLTNRLNSNLVARLNIDLVKGHPARIASLDKVIAEGAGEEPEYIAYFTRKRDQYQAEYDSYREAGLV